ncbi:two-component sensor histidine kinase [Actinomadura sp. NBRC 104412]|uniref:sensor histidine kinase n=1 Tax=Actinomadura sp. NBRC 104412 TaxID=3032203 RepID=UPI0024A426F8|nr:HAMP domain-containing sensor histidine kinase [Actinomadura sp. NBRC 104412]GLZ06636.1 two-component sensor histidine kinase [Actinomadura sp. NBRC 104412]
MSRRLTLLVAATTSLVLLAFLMPLALLVRTVAADRAMSSATIAAESAAALVSTLDRPALALALERAGTGQWPVTVFLPDGDVLGRPADRSPAVDLAARGGSITAQARGGREVLVAVQGLPEGTAVVRAFVPDAALTRGVARAWLILAGLGVVLLGMSLAVARRMARSLIRPTHDLAAVSHRLAAGELDARARPEGPAEFREVSAALNHLAGRITELLAQEREAAADLSHRLRTPLTALRLEIEDLSDPDEAARVGATVDELERAVTQVIADARRPARATAPDGCDAGEVVAERVRFWTVLADDQDRRLTALVSPAPLPVALNRDDLSAGVDALLGNVFAHTPEGTAFTVCLEPLAGGGARLTVSDEGPGFATSRPLERGASGSGSTGLGLDIARRAAESSGGRLTIGRSEQGGALVVLDLGGP